LTLPGNLVVATTGSIAGQDSNTVGGNARVIAGTGQLGGGDANIEGGFAVTGSGGRVNIRGGGSGDGPGSFGLVNIVSGSYTWQFDNGGNLTAPANATFRSAGANANINFHPNGNGLVKIEGSNDILLLLTSETPGKLNRLEIDTFGNSATLGGTFTGTFSRGTDLSNLYPVQAGDRLSAFKAKGWNGVNLNAPTGQITIEAHDNWNVGNTPTQISFWTTGYANVQPVVNMRISPTGNVEVFNGNLIVTGGGGYLRGNINTGSGGMYAGIPDFTQLGSEVVAQFGANVNNYSQINFQNISNGAQASGDIVITADNGNDINRFINMGIASSEWDGTQDNSLGNALAANDGYLYVNGGNLVIGTVVVGATNTWTFDAAGNLNLPGNIIAINYADGNRVIGDITFSGEAVIGTGTSNTQSGLYLAPDPVSLTNDLYLRVRGNIYDEPTHIHFDTGNNAYYNQYIGDDNKYILLANTGNVVVNTNDNAGNSAQWNFNNFGTLTLPGGSQLSPLGANLDIFANGGYVNLITADESSRVGVSGAGGFITTAGGTWNFNTNGNLTAPGNISAVGNIIGGNITVGSGTITGGNVNGATFNGNVAFGTGTVGGIGNITGGNISAIGNITGNTAGFAIGYRDIPQVSFTGNATVATTDAGKHFYSTQSTNYTLTIANNASQGFQVGAAITVVNQGTGTITIAQGSGVTLYLAGNATSGNRSVSTFGMATIMKIATDTWFINGTGVS
jgi:hypothetical protein